MFSFKFTLKIRHRTADFQGIFSKVPMIVKRSEALSEVTEALQNNPIVAILGPRQCGKTTLARHIAQNTDSIYFDLEDPTDLLKLSNPKLAFQNQPELIVLDEVQRKADLFSILRVLADRDEFASKFLLLGSASPELVKDASESLAGRIAFIEISGFSLKELGSDPFDSLWLRGSFPRSFLATSEKVSWKWRNDFIRTFLERDIPQLGINIPAATLRRFWTMVAHYHGTLLNNSELARSMSSSEATMRRYLDILRGAYVLRSLQPWSTNLRKRQVKTAKIYIRDSGLLHSLLSIRSKEGLLGHPKYGLSWEGFGIEQVLSVWQPGEAFFWATHAGAELDLLIFVDGRPVGFEFKCTDTPKITPSMRIALEDLNLDRLFIVYPGSDSFPIHEKIEVLSIHDLEKTFLREQTRPI